MKQTHGFGRMIITLLAAVCLLVSGTVLEEGEAPERDAKLAPYKTVGSIVTFGHYEQDNHPENGPEEIEWIVLDVDGDKALLLSRFGLDVVQYNRKYVAVTWETCTLRKWMNETFLSAAFSDSEQSAILVTDVDNSPEQGHAKFQVRNSGNNTQDRIFALSWAEANRYLDVTYENANNMKARVAPTPYAIARGAWHKREWTTEEGLETARWWLRSPGRHPNRASYVHCAGTVRDNQVTAGSSYFGYPVARPALLLNLEAEIF